MVDQKPRAVTLNPHQHPIPSDNAILQNVSVGNTATDLLPIVKAGRLGVCFQNKGTASLFIGPTSSVTAAGATQGIELVAGEKFSCGSTDAVTWYGIRAGGAEVVGSLQI